MSDAVDLSGERRAIIRHCAVHTGVSSAFSFCFAIISGFYGALQILGMVAGIGFFLACAIGVHLSPLMRALNRDPLRASSIALGKRIRYCFAIAEFPAFFIPPFSRLAMIDIGAGMLGAAAAEQLLKIPARSFREPIPEQHQFLFTFIATVTEGFILAAGLMVLCAGIYVLRLAYRRLFA